MGETSDLASILDSEMKVLKSLDYLINIPTPYQYLELILELLGMNKKDVDTTELHGVAVKVLEVFYYSREEYVTNLCTAYTGDVTQKLECSP